MKRVKIEAKFQPASLLKRFFAYIIDIFLINFIVSIPFASYFENKFSSPKDILLGSKTDGSLFFISFLILVLVLFYFVIMEYKTGQTIGSMVFGIYAVSITGKKLAFGQSIIRNILKPFPIVLLVDSFYIFFKGEGRRLFEVFSATATVERGVLIK